METRRLSRAIVYDKVFGEYVFLLLKAKKGYWQNPQGGIDEGETEVKAASREVKEETSLESIAVHEFTRYYDEYDTERKGEMIHTKLAAYAVLVDSSQEVKLSVEDGHTDSVWANYGKATSLLTKYPEQMIFFDNVVRKLFQSEIINLIGNYSKNR